MLNEKKGLSKELEDIKKCIVCKERSVCILLRPCNHMCLCNSCVQPIEKCPLCRTFIEHYEKIYINN